MGAGRGRPAWRTPIGAMSTYGGRIVGMRPARYADQSSCFARNRYPPKSESASSPVQTRSAPKRVARRVPTWSAMLLRLPRSNERRCRQRSRRASSATSGGMRIGCHLDPSHEATSLAAAWSLLHGTARFGPCTGHDSIGAVSSETVIATGGSDRSSFANAASSEESSPPESSSTSAGRSVMAVVRACWSRVVGSVAVVMVSSLPGAEGDVPCSSDDRGR